MIMDDDMCESGFVASMKGRTGQGTRTQVIGGMGKNQ